MAKRFLTSTEIKALWLEKNISEQLTSGNGSLIAIQAEGPTGRFRREELGLGWEEHPSILTVQSTIRSDNRNRRDTLHRETEKLLTAFRAEAKKQGLRADVKPILAATGCTGCPSCVPETRSKPRRSRDPAHRRNSEPTWIPRRDVDRRRIPASAAQAESQPQDRRKGAGEARRRMNQRRRAEQEIVRDAVRRSGVVISDTTDKN